MAHGGYQGVRTDDDAWFRSCGRLDDELCYFFVMGVFCFFGLLGWMDSDVVWCTRGWCCFGCVVNLTRTLTRFLLLYLGLVLTMSIAWFA